MQTTNSASMAIVIATLKYVWALSVVISVPRPVAQLLEIIELDDLAMFGLGLAIPRAIPD